MTRATVPVGIRCAILAVAALAACGSPPPSADAPSPSSKPVAAVPVLDAAGAEARAWAERALALGTIDDATDPLVRRPRAKTAARRAIAASAQSAAAMAALAFVHYRFDWQWADAEAQFAKALAANPSDPLARHQYGVFLATMGRTNDALTELGLALQVEPDSMPIRRDMVAPLLRASRTAEARTAIDAVAAVLPGSPLVLELQSDVFAAEGLTLESGEALLKSLAARGISPARISALRAALKSGGITALKEQYIRQLTAEIEDGPTPPRSFRLATDLALAHASLKRRDPTLHWLAVAIDLHEDAPLHMRSSPHFDFVRDEPRFKELLRRARFVAIER